MNRLCLNSAVRSLAIAVLASLPVAGSAQDEKKDEKPSFKRRDDSSDEDLRKQLLKVPEVGFDQIAAATLVNFVSKATTGASLPRSKSTPIFLAPDMGMNFYAQVTKQLKKPDLFALPWRTGVDTQLGKDSAEELHVYSVNLRLCMQQSVPANDVRPDPEKLLTALTGGKVLRPVKGKGVGAGNLRWNKPECVPTLAQMLQTENTPLRMLLVEMLDKIEGKQASVVLAQRAVFDLSPQVREKAVEILAKRPVKEFQPVLIDGLRWPWQPAADHAAEAIGALKLKDALPELVAMLKEPDPKYPFAKDGKEKGTYIREVVRMNHMSNCLLCHAPSLSKDDLVRGRIPVPGQEMPPAYYGATTGQFVRADTTFLRQDFSVVQPVPNPGKWLGQQRYDYMLRTRKATTKEVAFHMALQKEKKLDTPYMQRDAVLFALRGITGKDLGSKSEAWTELLNPFIEKK